MRSPLACWKMPDFDRWPTFDRCPECSGMLWTDGRGTWCEDCAFSFEQAELDFPVSPDAETSP